MKQMEKDLLGYSDLKVKGHGSRTTVWRKIRDGKFPPPDVDDGSGHPRWFPETIDKHVKSLAPYSPSIPESLRSVTA